ncbi:hypothetical protein RYX36_011491, partial [Vicia faba]
GVLIDVLTKVETKQAMYVCSHVLHQRHVNTWKRVNTLCFNSNSHQNLNDFDEYVNRVLTQRGNFKVNTRIRLPSSIMSHPFGFTWNSLTSLNIQKVRIRCGENQIVSPFEEMVNLTHLCISQTFFRPFTPAEFVISAPKMVPDANTDMVLQAESLPSSLSMNYKCIEGGLTFSTIPSKKTLSAHFLQDTMDPLPPWRNINMNNTDWWRSLDIDNKLEAENYLNQLSEGVLIDVLTKVETKQAIRSYLLNHSKQEDAVCSLFTGLNIKILIF